MYCKYNAILRDLGHLHSNMPASTRATQSAREMSEMLVRHQSEKEANEKGKPEKLRKGRGFPGHTSGNLYTTTLVQRLLSIPPGLRGAPRPLLPLLTPRSCDRAAPPQHVINSSVLKLGKLSQARVVYRGISFSTLPTKMKRKDPESLTRGGIEFGFTSCSLDKAEAQVYAGSGEEANKTPIILEMQQGMIDRGAGLSWISQ